MGDPICKWRNASVWTTVELVRELPKKTMPSYKFREIMADSIYGAAFQRTSYQLACQLGLYYEDGGYYYPRFDHNINNQEALNYLHHWIQNYYVPNPYTARKFENMDYSLKLMYAIAEFAQDLPQMANLETACNSLFGEPTGNILCIRYILNEYSNIMRIDKDNNITVLVPTNVDPFVYVSRYDKRAFFDSFNI